MSFWVQRGSGGASTDEAAVARPAIVEVTVKIFCSWLFASIVCALSIVLGGCGGAYMTQQEIETNGTKSYPVPKAQLVESITVVLKGMGYEVVRSDPEKGVVTTARKEIGQSTYTAGVRGRSTSSSHSMTTGYYRQYLVRIEETSAGVSRVRVTPKVFIGERDVSEDKVWNIDGRGGERELWHNIFRDLEASN